MVEAHAYPSIVFNEIADIYGATRNTLSTRTEPAFHALPIASTRHSSLSIESRIEDAPTDLSDHDLLPSTEEVKALVAKLSARLRRDEDSAKNGTICFMQKNISHSSSSWLPEVNLISS